MHSLPQNPSRRGDLLRARAPSAQPLARARNARPETRRRPGAPGRCGRRALHRHLRAFCRHPRGPARAAHRDRPRAADRRDRLPNRRDTHRHRLRHARQPRAAPRTGGVRADHRQMPRHLAHPDHGAVAPPRRHDVSQPHRTTRARAPSPSSAPVDRNSARIHRPTRRCVLGHANTLVLDAPSAADLLPKGVQLDSTEATQALNQLESSYDYLIFLADAELTPWSQKAIRHADLVLAVARTRIRTQRARTARRRLRQHRGAPPRHRA